MTVRLSYMKYIPESSFSYLDVCGNITWWNSRPDSIEFHERGKKHKENVQKRIQEVQKKGKETSQAQKQLQMDLEAIEAAALKAYEKDLNIEPSKSNPESNAKSQKHRQMKLVPMVKALLVLEKGVNITIILNCLFIGCLISYEGQTPIMNCNHGWNIAQAPEGYYYYYNTATQALSVTDHSYHSDCAFNDTEAEDFFHFAGRRVLQPAKARLERPQQPNQTRP
ncbi:WW domain-binding protein 4 [Stylophora pistillata]|uniref:WW domain-binding protein 4 n=1 Tax=Stylophora pistillata TaxID=50429 RepID=A0A2B4RBB4_STYPI|nr:WW domain-binding protein 4 [Stylophora pistillata]